MKKKFLIEKKTQGPWPYDVEAVHEGFIMKAPEVKPPTKHKVKRVPMTYEAETDPVLLARWDGEALKKKDKMVYEYISLPTLSGECKRLNELTAKNMEPDVRWKCFKSFILNEINNNFRYPDKIKNFRM